MGVSFPPHVGGLFLCAVDRDTGSCSDMQRSFALEQDKMLLLDATVPLTAGI